jgi:hypothetical protein
MNTTIQAHGKPRYVLPPEVIPGVAWPVGFRDSINSWSSEFLGCIPGNEVRKRVKKVNTMLGILEGLSSTFDNLQRGIESAYTEFALSETNRIGLMKIGPIVLNESFGFDGELPFESDNSKLPATFMIALNRGHESKSGEYLLPDFAFGVKIRKTPWTVAKVKGQAWQFGMAWRTGTGKLVWGYFYAYTRGGKVIPAQWLCDKTISTPVTRSPKGRDSKVFGRALRSSYTSRVWTYSSWSTSDPDEAVKICMSNALSMYLRRREHWNVSVTKEGKRATFLIDGTQTADAFKDRTTIALAVDGKRKRIIHYVREHTQNRGDGSVVQIPAHIRGMREFDWNEYHCFVTSPEHHSFLIDKFTVESDEYGEDEEIYDTMSLPETADLLVKMEDECNKRVTEKRRRK